MANLSLDLLGAILYEPNILPTCPKQPLRSNHNIIINGQKFLGSYNSGHWRPSHVSFSRISLDTQISDSVVRVSQNAPFPKIRPRIVPSFPHLPAHLLISPLISSSPHSFRFFFRTKSIQTSGISPFISRSLATQLPILPPVASCPHTISHSPIQRLSIRPPRCYQIPSPMVLFPTHPI